eukprot:246402-Chlamydomonas_euryale.AAC.1
MRWQTCVGAGAVGRVVMATMCGDRGCWQECGGRHVWAQGAVGRRVMADMCGGRGLLGCDPSVTHPIIHACKHKRLMALHMSSKEHVASKAEQSRIGVIAGRQAGRHTGRQTGRKGGRGRH